MPTAKQSRRQRLIERRRFVAKAKDRPCADCGGRFPFVCMDFDHVSGEKKAGISLMVEKVRPWGELKAEIAKCEVFCANCHRLRTWTRGQQHGGNEPRQDESPQLALGLPHPT